MCSVTINVGYPFQFCVLNEIGDVAKAENYLFSVAFYLTKQEVVLMLSLLWRVFAPVRHITEVCGRKWLLTFYCEWLVFQSQSQALQGLELRYSYNSFERTNGGWFCTIGRNEEHKHPYHPWDFSSWFQAIQRNWRNAKKTPAPWSL
jgi:hypothetical protein